MTRTYRIYNKLNSKLSESRYHPFKQKGYGFWYNHDPPKYRRYLNRQFRRQNKAYFKKFGEIYLKQQSKNRGWYW